MKNRFLNKYLPLIPILFVIVVTVASHSCANTTQAPTGGKKDTIPPVITRINPPSGVLGVPLTGARFYLTFDEYVKVKDAKNIFLSPPLRKAPKYKMKGKTLMIYFEDTLTAETTYTLQFTDAIADNNEGNIFQGFTYAFSTGDRIDSMMITGTVRDCNTLNPIKGATVLLYKDLADSAVFLSRPFAATRTDDWGYFVLRNIPDTTYRLYAIKDANSDNLYNPDEELIAFIDSLIHPVMKINDSLPELQQYDMKDTLLCLARKSEYDLNMFKERPSKQLLKNSKRISDRSAYITFMAPDAHIDTMWVKGFKSDRLITQFNLRRDSLEIWFNEKRRLPDTLHLFVNYMKTDSSGLMIPFTEEVRLYQEGAGKKFGKSRGVVAHTDTICSMEFKASPERVEQYGFELEFKYPIVSEHFDSIRFYSISPKQTEEEKKFKVERDSTNLRKYTLRPDFTLLSGFEYVMNVPAGTFRDINGFLCDSTEVKVSLPNDDKLSSISLEMQGVDNKYIVDLLDEKKTTILRSYTIDSDCTLLFPYLKKGTYSIRITEDKNRNGIVDTGNLLDHREPEKVIFYKLQDSSEITVQESTELVQTIDIKALFEDSDK